MPESAQREPLREFLYLDIDKVRALAAQLYEGVVETTVEDATHSKQVGGSLVGLRYQKQWGASDRLEKSMADAIFPALELDLESLGLLKDVSEKLIDPTSWSDIRSIAPVGSIIRITGPAALFDARYFTTVMAGLISAAQGVSAFADQAPSPSEDVTVIPPKAKTETQKRAARKARSDQGQERPDPVDDLLPPGRIELMEESVTREQIVGMIKLARGVFSPGLHMTLYPATVKELAVSLRLEEGRRFLDSDPEILFQRYGLQPQEWTVVGFVGHHGVAAVSSEFGEIVDSQNNVSRGKTAGALNGFAAFIAHLGFADLPRSPGFSLIPLAVYRTIHEFGE